MVSIVLVLLIALNAAWSVGTLLPECCSLAARTAAFVVGGAVGMVLFNAWETSLVSLLVALVGSILTGTAAAWFVTRGTSRLVRMRAALQQG